MATVQEPARPVPRHESFVEAELARARRRIRGQDLGAAALGLAAGTLAYALGMVLLDRWLLLPDLARQLALAGYLLAAAAYVAGVLLWPFRREVNPYFAARQVERAVPGAKNSVVSWLDLRDEPLPPSIRNAVGLKAATDLKRAHLDDIIRDRRLPWLGGLAGGLFVAALILFFLLRPAPFLSLLHRALLPFTSTTIAAQTELTLLQPAGGDVTVPVNTSVEFRVFVTGRVPDAGADDAVRLRFRYNPADPVAEEIRLDPTVRDPREWAVRVPPNRVQNGFVYQVVAGDAATPEYRVQVRSSPLIEGFEVLYHFRPYLRYRDQTATQPNLEALRGTEVTLTARTNRTVRGGALTFLDPAGNPLADRPPLAAELLKDQPNSLRFRFVMEQDGKYKIAFQSAEGEKNQDPIPYTVRVLSDYAPQVEVTHPAPDTLPVNGTLQVEGKASDDFGITKMRLHLQVKDGPDAAKATPLAPKPYRPEKSFQFDDGTFPRTLDYKDFQALDQLKTPLGVAVEPKAGLVVEYWLEAEDNCDYPQPNVGRSKVHRVTLAAQQDEKDKRDEQQQAAKEKQQHDQQQDQQHAQENAAKNQQQQQQNQGENPNADQQPQPGEQPPNPQDKPQDQQGNQQGGNAQDQNLEQKARDALEKMEQRRRDQEKGEGKGEGQPQQADPQNPGPPKGEPKGDNQQPNGNPQNQAGNPQQQPGQPKGEQKGDPKGQQPQAGDAPKGEGKPEGKPQQAPEPGEAKPQPNGGQDNNTGQQDANQQNPNPQPNPQQSQPNGGNQGQNPNQSATQQPGGNNQGSNPGQPQAQQQPQPNSGQPNPGESKPQPQNQPDQPNPGEAKAPPQPGEQPGASKPSENANAGGQNKGSGDKGGQSADQPKAGSPPQDGSQQSQPGSPNAQQPNQGANGQNNTKPTQGSRPPSEQAPKPDQPKAQQPEAGKGGQPGEHNTSGERPGQGPKKNPNDKEPNSNKTNANDPGREGAEGKTSSGKPGDAPPQPGTKPEQSANAPDGQGGQPEPQPGQVKDRGQPQGPPPKGDAKPAGGDTNDNDPGREAPGAAKGDPPAKGEVKDAPKPGPQGTNPPQGEVKTPGTASDRQPQGNGKPDKTPPGNDQARGEGQGTKGELKPDQKPSDNPNGRKPSADEIAKLAEQLRNADPNTRRELQKKLEDLVKNNPGDAQTREAIEKALKQSGDGNAGGPKPDQKGDQRAANDQPKRQPGDGAGTGAKPDAAKPPQPGERGGEQQPGQAPQAGQPRPDQRPQGQGREPGPGDPGAQGQRPKGQANRPPQPGQPGAENPPKKPGDNTGDQSDHPGKTPSEPAPSSKPVAPDGSGVPGATPPGPANQAAGKSEAEYGPPPDANYTSKTGDLQLERFPKNPDKDLLKDLGMTADEYKQFLRQLAEYEKRRKATQANDAGNLQRGAGRGASAANSGARRVEGGTDKAGNLDRGVVAPAPAEFRDGYKGFTEDVSKSAGPKKE
jgi:hypothetical protein